MATDNLAQYGFRWAGYIDGTPGPQPLVSGFVATAYAATTAHLRVGDPLIKLSDGSVALATAGATNPIDYIFAGVERYWDGTKMTTNPFLPSGTVWTTLQRQARILMTPITAGRWEIDADDAVTFTTEATYQACIGENADVSKSVDSTGYYTNPRLDISTHATTSTLQVRIVDVSKTFLNADFAGKYVKLIVAANVTQMVSWTAAGQTGV